MSTLDHNVYSLVINHKITIKTATFTKKKEKVNNNKLNFSNIEICICHHDSLFVFNSISCGSRGLPYSCDWFRLEFDYGYKGTV